MTTPAHSISSGNVYADFGDENADDMQVKSRLARQIYYDMQDRGLTQAQVADMLGIDQPKVSAMIRGRLRDFSVDRLRHFVTRMGHDVTIIVHASTRTSAGRTTVETGPEPMAASAATNCDLVRFD